MKVRLAVDIGGTFTDAVAFLEETGEIRTGKTLTTPGDLVAGIDAAIGQVTAEPGDAWMLVHGSTVVINSLIERNGARAALITTKGFRDVYEIGRINRPDSFNLHFSKHRPLIPREMTYEVPERILADGSVETALDEDAARTVIREVVAQGAESVAVVFLHAYRNPSHEERMGQLLAEEAPGLFVTLSHELTREYREFERTSTTAANAYVGPVVTSYLQRLAKRLTEISFKGTVGIMQSNGGLTDLAAARRDCVQMMESGPAGGAVGAASLCATLGLPQAIAFDMGGTTAKASLVRAGAISEAAECFVGGYAQGLPIRVPMVDIVEVGTGGGSIAWLDDADGVHVGPRSAGASPGPACYGNGGREPTVTDAAMTLGYLPASGTLSGGLRLDAAAAARTVGELAARIGLDTSQCARGLLEIAASSMADAVRAVTIERGMDPRDFALFAYGGSGPLYISLVARDLGIGQVLVPPHAAVFSALGMLLADAKRNYVVTTLTALDRVTMAELDTLYRGVEEKAAKALTDTGIGVSNVVMSRSADMRYIGQEHTVTVPVPGRLGDGDRHVVKERFDAAHERLYSHSAPDERAEVVSIRVAASGLLPRPDLTESPTAGPQPPAGARTGERLVVWDPAHGHQRCPVYRREALLPGNVLDGPAIIEEEGTTTVLQPGDRLRVESHGCLVVTIGA
jgi:N-methylhydantoinase A